LEPNFFPDGLDRHFTAPGRAVGRYSESRYSGEMLGREPGEAT
jgi:hypothetical protein